MEFDWDNNKAVSNVKKHKISFQEAQTVFDDDFSLTIEDEAHSIKEKRFLTIGHSFSGRLIIISHTFEENKIRIISARKPIKSEREDYENG